MMYVNNEVGFVQLIEKVGEVLKEYLNILFYVDYVQGIYKVFLVIEKVGIDLCLIFGYKFYGLKGIGVFIVKEGICFIFLIMGGFQ